MIWEVTHTKIIIKVDDKYQLTYPAYKRYYVSETSSERALHIHDSRPHTSLACA